MRTTLVLTALFALSYPYLPSPSTGSASPSLSPDAQAQLQTAPSKDVPFITRLIAQYTPSAKTWSERNDKHLELVKDAAEERLLFQEAERTRVWRWRNASYVFLAQAFDVLRGWRCLARSVDGFGHG